MKGITRDRGEWGLSVRKKNFNYKLVKEKTRSTRNSTISGYQSQLLGTHFSHYETNNGIITLLYFKGDLSCNAFNSSIYSPSFLFLFEMSKVSFTQTLHLFSEGT